MSYFSTIYSDNSLPVRAKTVYMYLRDRSDKGRKCWPRINTIAAELNCSRSTVNEHCTIWRSTDICDGCRDTEKAAAVLLICMYLSVIDL